MDLKLLTKDAIYMTHVAEDATYINASGAALSVRVIERQESADYLQQSELAVQGVSKEFFVRKSQVSKPTIGDRVMYRSESWCVDDWEDFSALEWVIRVKA